jgi:hypothetical protein
LRGGGAAAAGHPHSRGLPDAHVNIHLLGKCVPFSQFLGHPVDIQFLHFLPGGGYRFLDPNRPCYSKCS